jgi:predicted acylesterase/phospholipase RssA/CRP-like cAMP-binding protein
MTGAPDQQIRQVVEDYFGVKAEPSLLEKFELVTLAGGEWLFRHGDPGDSLFLLVRGRMQVWDETAGDEEGNEFRLLGEIVPGESVGEVGLLSGEPRSAGIRAIRDSQLLRLERKAFESLAGDHPALVMKLASNIAAIVQRSVSKTASSVRRLATISLLPLSPSPRLSGFCTRLVGALEKHGTTLEMARERLGARGAPVARLDEEEAVPDALVHWLHDRENDHSYLVYTCDPSDTAWTRFAIRQSDIVLYIGEADEDPEPAGWEKALGEDPGGAVARPTLVLLQPSAATELKGTAGWLDARSPEFHLHVRENVPDDVDRVARVVSGNATGLVLAGGAARGIAHLGVYKAMLELGVPIDWVGGVSIGSIMGAGIAMDLGMDEALEKARHALVKVRPFSDYTLPLVSLVSGRRMERVLEELFTRRIEDLPKPYFCVSCRMDDGALNVHERGAVATALRASASMPGIFPPPVVEQRLPMDGSVINNLPVDVMQQKPVGKVIAVDLSSQKSYEVPYSRVPPAWKILRGMLLPFMRVKGVPRLATTMLKSTELGTLGLVHEQGQRAGLLLRPPVRQFGMTEVKAFDRMVELTYEYALKELAGWLETRDG